MRNTGGGEEVYSEQAMNEVDAGRHCATPASVRHDHDALRRHGRSVVKRRQDDCRSTITDAVSNSF